MKKDAPMYEMTQVIDFQHLLLYTRSAYVDWIFEALPLQLDLKRIQNTVTLMLSNIKVILKYSASRAPVFIGFGAICQT